MPTLRFFRPPGLNLETTVRDFIPRLWWIRELAPSGAFPLDGIVFPKVEHPEEVELLDDLLARAEAALDLPVGSIRVGLLIEFGLECHATR